MYDKITIVEYVRAFRFFLKFTLDFYICKSQSRTISLFCHVILGLCVVIIIIFCCCCCLGCAFLLLLFLLLLLLLKGFSHPVEHCSLTLCMWWCCSLLLLLLLYYSCDAKGFRHLLLLQTHCMCHRLAESLE